ncbi:MAG TPA: hypothetical protein VMM60_17995, partial [Ilumatobacter sp.]|nr:hypothetical protein [Ilumatobacter sp.]
MVRIDRAWRRATVVMALLGAVGAVLVPVVRAVSPAPSSTPSGLVPIVPCRLIDTRPTTAVGPWSEPVGPDSTIDVEVRGINGNCAIPAAAVAIAANVTIVDPTAPSFLTLYPADAASVPNSSNLNWFAPSPPTPNHVTVGLSADGAIKVYNLAGDVHVIIDIVAYYTPLPATPIVTVPVTT